LCGVSSWRVPTVNELNEIIKFDTSDPAIDSFYFPNTQSNWFWTSSPSAKDVALSKAAEMAAQRGYYTLSQDAYSSILYGVRYAMQVINFMSGERNNGADYLQTGNNGDGVKMKLNSVRLVHD
ncbi:MAG: DUF1566 domain-containing protein, partial [Methylococcales bacterium]|nr:DUF1566 domain-containing protein [Methylococcales bacterium]